MIRSSENTHFAYDFVAYDLVKTRLSESEAEVEDQTNHDARFQALRLVSSSASASYSDNLVLTRSLRTEP